MAFFPVAGEIFAGLYLYETFLELKEIHRSHHRSCFMGALLASMVQNEFSNFVPPSRREVLIWFSVSKLPPGRISHAYGWKDFVAGSRNCRILSRPTFVPLAENNYGLY